MSRGNLGRETRRGGFDWEGIPRPIRVGDDEEAERRATEALVRSLRKRELYRGHQRQPRRCRRCHRQFEPGDFYAQAQGGYGRTVTYCASCADEQIELTERG